MAVYLLALASWLATSPASGVGGGVSASLILLAYASPILIALRHVFGRLGLAEMASATAVGLTLSGVVSTILRFAGLPAWSVPVVFVACALVQLAFRRSNQAASRMICIADASARRRITTTLAALVMLLPLSVVLIHAALAGSGDYPKFIFYSDDAFDLAMIRSLLASSHLPPDSLTFLNGSKPYHFGTLEAVANLVRLTSIAPHIAQFYIAFPVIEAGIIGTAWLLLRRVGKGAPSLLIACILVVAFNSNQSDFKLSFRLFTALADAIKTHSFSAEPSLLYLVVHLPTLGARMLTWFVLMLMFAWERPTARWMAAIVVGGMTLIDPFFFVSAGLLIGIWSLYRTITERHWREILPAALALLLGVIVARLSGSGGAAFKVVFAPLTCDYCIENTGEIFRNMVGLLGLGVILTLFFWRRVAVQAKIWVLVSLLLLLAVNLTALIYANQVDPNFNWFRLAAATPMLLAGFVALAIAQTWPHLNRYGQVIVAVLVAIATIIPIGRIPMVAVQVAAKPDRGDDVTETSALAEAMRSIPVAGSVVVTNDLRYPVIDYRYTLKNPLISALFGHQCYFCNGDGEADLPGADQRLAEVRQLAAPAWSDAIADLASRNHWTHFLVHKNWPHPATMPLKLVFENDQYAVYAF
ncbi:MAG TPA: hypothetical protein VND94_08270 [Terriglobia bacterium]|nr:hypothetical protein [Terriglobia bacterium]